VRVGEEVPGADWRRGWEDIVGGKDGVESVKALVKIAFFVAPVGLGGVGEVSCPWRPRRCNTNGLMKLNDIIKGILSSGKSDIN